MGLFDGQPFSMERAADNMMSPLGLAAQNLARFDSGGIDMGAAAGRAQMYHQDKENQSKTRAYLEMNNPELLPLLDSGASPAELLGRAFNQAQQQKQEAAEQQRREQLAQFITDPAAQQAYLADELDWEGARNFGQTAQADPFTLGEGQIRYDGAGNVIATGTASSPETIINNSLGGSNKFYDTMDAKLAEQTAALIDSGTNAQSNNIRLGQLETYLQTAPQGAEGALTQIVGSMGIPTEGLDDVQAAQALINQMVPGQRPPGSGTMSDADLALFKQSLPQIINQPGGNRKIVQTMKAINEYTIAQAQIAQRVANREISPAEGRVLQAQVPNPLSGMATTSAPAPSAAPGGAVPFTDYFQ